jgi:hypothetical protein
MAQDNPFALEILYLTVIALIRRLNEESCLGGIRKTILGGGEGFIPISLHRFLGILISVPIPWKRLYYLYAQYLYLPIPRYRRSVHTQAQEVRGVLRYFRLHLEDLNFRLSKTPNICFAAVF